MRVLMGRAGIWAFLILMTTFVTILAASTPIFEGLMRMGGGKRGKEYLPGPKRLVTADEGFRQGETPPELPPEPERVVQVEVPPADVNVDVPTALPRRQTPMAANRPKEGYLDAMTQIASRYFDLAEEAWKGRKEFLASIERMRDRGYDILGDPEWLMRLIYGARSFEPCMTDRKWQEANEIHDAEVRDRFVTIRGDGLDVGFRVPDSYPLSRAERRAFWKARPRPGPWPLLISTLDLLDARAPEPAREHFQRRYGAEAWSALHKDWFTLVPVAPDGQYVDPKTGKLRREYLIWQLVQFIRHYHVDYDRIVLAGGQEALLVASSQPLMFAGIVLRGGEIDERLRKTLVNLAPLPVFIHIQDAKENLSLGWKIGRRIGNANLTIGDDEDLRRWLQRLRRRPVRRFNWRIEGPEHQFAWWMNLEKVDFSASRREVEVEVDDFLNEIRIMADGVSELSLFLNDEIVDLDRPVRVMANGTLVREERLDRDFDMAFNRDPLRLRDSMYFGLVFPARMVRIKVPAAAPPDGPEKPPGQAASPEDEERARKLYDAAVVLAGDGETERAIKRLETVIQMGDTTWLGDAKALLDELKRR